MKKLNIAIVGLGNIGSYLYKYLDKNKKILSKKIIVFQILFMFPQKIKVKREILKFQVKNGLEIIWMQLKLKKLI